MRKKAGIFAAMGVVVLLLSGLVATVALAQGGGGESDIGPGFAARVAEHLGVSEQQFVDAVKAAKLEMLEEAVAAGTITEEEAAEIRQRIEEGEGLGLCDRLRDHRHFLGGVVRAVAEILDMTPRDLVGDLRDGQSLAEIGEAHGVGRDELKSKILSAADAKLDGAVANGTITQERADQVMSRLTENIDRILDWKRGGDTSTEGAGPLRRFLPQGHMW